MRQINLQVLFSVVLISIFASASSFAIEIRLPQGDIYGNLVNDESDRKYVEFIGIPYGKSEPFEVWRKRITFCFLFVSCLKINLI